VTRRWLYSIRGARGCVGSRGPLADFPPQGLGTGQSLMTGEHRASLSRKVTEADTAAAWDDVFPPAAATTFVLGLAQITCHQAIEELLSDGELTVGTAATIDHQAPSKVGAELEARAVLTDRAGRRLQFEVEVFDAGELVATVDHTRAIVSRDRIADLLSR